MPSTESGPAAVRPVFAPPRCVNKRRPGRVAVVGASEGFTGAPYFAAAAAVACGAELAQIMSPPLDAGPSVSIEPHVIVAHPSLGSWAYDSEWRAHIAEDLAAFDAVALGPGLKRDSKHSAEVVAVVTQLARDRHMPIVVDGAALHYVADRPDTVRGNALATLTADAAELSHLLATVAQKEVGAAELTGDMHRRNELAKMLAGQLGGVVVVAKGHTDYMTDGTLSAECTVDGCTEHRRSQGAMLAGALALFQAWTVERTVDALYTQTPLHAAHIVCTMVRRSARWAYAHHGLAFTGDDMLGTLPVVASHHCP